MTEEEWDDLNRRLRNRDDTEVAVAAAQQLQEVATRDDLPKLMEMLNDEDSFLREAAAWPVSELAGPASLETLLAAYQRGMDEGHDNDGLAAALIGLVEKQPEASRETLQRLAGSGDKAKRDNAQWLLEFCHPG
jgi:HEAT repeat protein